VKVLVSGADGLIGHEAVSRLLSCGHEVTGLYRSLDCQDKQKSIDILNIDLATENVCDTVKEKNIDVVVHCAASLPRFNDENEMRRVARLNKKIDENIFSLCKKRKYRLIYLSGTSIYVDKKDGIINESDSVSSSNQYLKQKLWAEAEVKKLSISSVILRVSSPYGRRQKSQTVLKKFIENTLKEKTLFYFGSGSRTQDFISCMDVANSICKVIDKPDIQGIFNIASGDSISMKNLANLVVSISPSNNMIKVLPTGKDDDQENYRAKFDISKAQKLLCWTPVVKLDKGIHDFFKGYLL